MKFIGILGVGAFGSVKLRREENGSLVAVKIYNRVSAGERSDRVIQEKTCLQRLTLSSNKHIVKLFSTDKDDTNLYFVLEAALGGTLHRHVAQSWPSGLPIVQASRLYAELIFALHHMHSLGVMHRDLKLNNCLLDSNGHLKIADFGSSKTIFDLEDCQVSDPRLLIFYPQ
jgi:serine/threonine protein kinase